jgi:D-alanyl-D-alanine dipeptidase
MPLRVQSVVALLFLSFNLPAGELRSQPTVIRSLDSLRGMAQQNPEQNLLELKNLCPTLRYELRYAGKNNFVGKNMYPIRTRTTYLRQAPATALCRVQEELLKRSTGLKIWDAYRPYAVTVAFWEMIGDERYVANPAKGSGHNRGVAVDLTLVDLNTGKELPMGTGFDHFSDTAHHSFKNLPENILDNRQLLRGLMEKHGFKAYEEEWWHYSWPDPAKYDVLDIPFPKLNKLIGR